MSGTAPGGGRCARHPVQQSTVQTAGSRRLYASRMQSRIASCVVRSSVEERSNAKLRRPPFTEYCREGNVTFFPPSRRSHTAKPTSFIPLSGPASASKITSASASFPGGLPLSFGMIRTDTTSAFWLDIKSSCGHRLSETSGAGEVRRFLRTPRDEGGRTILEGSCVVTDRAVDVLI